MSTIIIRRKIRSTLLKIRELDRYRGKEIELEIKVKELKKTNADKKAKTLAGSLSKYANIDLWEKESNAWALAVKEKNENYRR